MFIIYIELNESKTAVRLFMLKKIEMFYTLEKKVLKRKHLYIKPIL